MEQQARAQSKTKQDCALKKYVHVYTPLLFLDSPLNAFSPFLLLDWVCRRWSRQNRESEKKREKNSEIVWIVPWAELLLVVRVGRKGRPSHESARQTE